MSTKKLPKKKQVAEKATVDDWDNRTTIRLNESEAPKGFDGTLKGKYNLEVNAELIESGIGMYGEEKGKKYFRFAINSTKINTKK